MLKGHRACIDLEKNVLRIQGREVSFLSEHELPEKARDPKELGDIAPEGLITPGPSTPAGSSTSGTPGGFPGGGRTLGAAPSTGPSRPLGNRPTPGGAPKYPEATIRTLMDLGASRELAVSTLDAAGGNVDVAASLLF
ncbi:hypothetical protein CPB83DRAFT_205514 [Crepidotus variabilis]|uniref:UBA domain-containing protein n=1 Tax=Crepidotus variabilis TaxID=179855 RepID=A0A9P6JWK3_9AGAR|nr:hypothetical protein CPB83DRAFT_205514 [Crepidotus variabilis]